MVRIDLKKFKKIDSDEHSSLLQHPEGHSIRIAHKALDKKTKAQLDSLPLHKGGKASNEDPTQRNLLPGDKEPNKIEKEVVNKDKSRMKMASGGNVADKKKLDIEAVEDKRPLDISEDNEIHPEQNGQPAQESDEDAKDVYLADGGEAEHQEEEIDPAIREERAPAEINSLEAFKNMIMGNNQPQDAQQPSASQSSDQGVVGPSPASQSQQSSGLAPQQSPQPQIPPRAQGNDPDLMGGYNKQIQGINQGAAAEGALGKEQAKTLGQSVEQQQQLLGQFQDNYKQLDEERKNHVEDINNGMIDPTKYWDNHSKLATGIGIILAGFNPTNRPNAAVEFLNREMDRNMQAQAQNLQAKNNLLNANLHQFGNMRDAISMTKVMQSDMVSNQLKQEAAKATDPMVKARALQAAGQLESQVAPEFLQLSMRRSLMQQGGNGQQSGVPNVSHQDPASYVPYVVPKDQQKEVFHEISTAQNTAKNGDEIMKNFDQAAKDNTVMGRLEHGFSAPASILGMRASMLPIIHDAEGRVNEFEQKTTSDLEPKPGDTDAKVASKREQLLNFLNQKRSAPTAKGYGIDLNNFQSTAQSPVARMSPQQQSFVQWAKQNPNDPRSEMILKKLGVK